MARPFLPAGVERPDFYLAAMGRSGSTMICNWLTDAPDQLVFIEPSFLSLPNTRLLRIQLDHFGMAASDAEWAIQDQTAEARFQRLMSRRLARKRWGLKEVLCSEHRFAIERLMPRRVVISARNIGDVALSFFEKHRLQGNLNRFDDQWVVDYCIREAAGLVALRMELEAGSLPFAIVRYEDFTRSEDSRQEIADFISWRGGGPTAAQFDRFDRSFEVERHGSGVSAHIRTEAERDLGQAERELASHIARQCEEYQRVFGYQLDIYSNVNNSDEFVCYQ